MRDQLPTEVEKYRDVKSPYASPPNSGPNGRFFPWIANNRVTILASNGTGWEHVSVSVFLPKARTPTWDEMCIVKDWFWEDNEAVIQFHPPKVDYVNFHPHVLHLWRPVGYDIRLPPTALVGPLTRKRH